MYKIGCEAALNVRDYDNLERAHSFVALFEGILPILGYFFGNTFFLRNLPHFGPLFGNTGRDGSYIVGRCKNLAAEQP